VVERIFRHLPETEWDRPQVPDRFTPREIVAHLAEWEPILRDRIRAAVEQPGTTIAAFDEVEMARAAGYERLDPYEQIALFARERALTAEYLRTLTASDWTGSAHHPERGPQSAEDLANLILGHDLYHIEQLTASL
jgi:hypothetical protein